jgi:hypothetical protein
MGFHIAGGGPRGITVTADAQGREYGDANPALGFALTRSGGMAGPALVPGDTLTGGTLAIKWTGEEPSQTKGFNNKKTWSAQYKAATVAAGDLF